MSVACLAAGPPAPVPDSPVFPKKTVAGLSNLFAQYACDRERLSSVPAPDPATLAEFPEYRDQIEARAARGTDFACRYAIVQWGCGSACQTGVAVDLIDGAIQTLPTSEWGRLYRADSRLLIQNPPSEKPEENERPEYGYPAYYLFSGAGFVLLHDTRRPAE
ncbi:MAG: hypothetical protein RIF32_04550 [Leptospirales bacterium]